MPVKAGVVYVEEVAPLPPVTSAQPELPFGDCCHWMVPVFPVKLMVVLPPLHIVDAVAVAVPPTLTGFTVMVA